MVPERGVQDFVASARSLAARLPQLVDESRRMAVSLRSGLHGNRKVGPGSDFWQFRPYVAGDPASQIDWRRSARSDHTFIRQTEWQASHTYWIWPVLSASTYWTSDRNLPQKSDRILVLALALADLFLRNGETVGTFDPEQTRITSAEYLEKLAVAMLASPTDLPAASSKIHAGRKHTILVLSDFLEFADPDPAPSQSLHRLSRAQNDGALIHILDPAELAPPFHGRVEFVDTDSHPIYNSPRFEDVREGFERRAEKWRARIYDAAIANSWLHASHITSQSASPALLSLYQNLSERQAGLSRRHTGPDNGLQSNLSGSMSSLRGKP